MHQDPAVTAAPIDRAGVRRRRIVDTARRLFVANGFHGTGVARIARESGVAVGQLYRDFAAKEDIVAAIVTGDCATFMARGELDAAIARDDHAAIWDWIRGVVAPSDDDSDPMFAEIVAESSRNARIAAIFERTRAAADEPMRTALALLAPGDALAARRAVLADVVFAQSLGLMQHRLLRPGHDTRPMVDIVMTMIATEIDAMRAA